MALGVWVTGRDGFGGELWDVDARWWDGSRVQDYFGSRLKSSEPAPAWSARIGIDEMTTLMGMFPAHFESHQRLSDKLNNSIKNTEDFEITVYEWSSE